MRDASEAITRNMLGDDAPEGVGAFVDEAQAALGRLTGAAGADAVARHVSSIANRRAPA